MFFYLFSMCSLHRQCSVKEVFLKIPQYSLKNMRVGDSNTHTRVFLWILRIFKNTFFEEHLQTVASVTKALIVLLLRFVMIQTYKTFWISIFTALHANLATKIKEHGDISFNSNVTIIWKYRKRSDPEN